MVDEMYIREMEIEENDKMGEILKKTIKKKPKKRETFGCTYCGQDKPLCEKSKSYKSVCKKCAKDIADWGCE